MVYPVGLEFRPTDEEIVDHYLRRKNLDSDTSLVDGVINTVNICSFDPWGLPSQSKLESRDQVWYFFGRKEKKYNRGDQQSRKTESGFWKKTGKTMDVLRKRGNREKIGEKKVLVFQYLTKNPSGSRSNWIMHEYHAAFLPPHQKVTYVVCKVEFKGEESEILPSPGCETGSTSHSLVPPMNIYEGFSTGSEGSTLEWTNQELQIQPPFTGVLEVDVMDTTFHDLWNDHLETWFNDDDDEQGKIGRVQEHCNVYTPKRSLTRVFSGLGSDDNGSGLISLSTKTIHTSSTCYSFGSSSSHHRVDQIKPQESANSTIELVSLTQMVNQALDHWIDSGKPRLNQDTEIRQHKLDHGIVFEEHKLSQETIKNKRSIGSLYRKLQKIVKKKK